MTASGGAYGVEELLRAGVLQQEAAGPCLQGVEEVVVAVEGGHDDDVPQVLGDEVAGGLDAVHPRHLDVHQHDVGAGRPRLLDRLEPVGGLADDLDVVLDRSTMAKPERTIAWSSTSSTRSGFIAGPSRAALRAGSAPAPGSHR